jgi:hypothetical protein
VSRNQAECPRCGYDQSGIIAAWDHSCPLDGVCSECGLTFVWRDLLNERYTDLPGFFEHAPKRVRSFYRTWWAARRPSQFWQWVRMEHRIVPNRLAVATALGALQTHALLCVAVFALYATVLLVGPLIPAWAPIYGGGAADGWANVSLNSVWPLGRDSKYNLWRFGNRFLGIYIRPLELVAIGTSLLMPLTFVLLRTTLNRARVKRSHVARVWVYGLVWLPLMLHLPGLLTGVTLLLDTSLIALIHHVQAVTRLTWRLNTLDPFITLVAVCLWQAIWWTLACNRYLRLPHALAIGAMMTTMAALTSAAAVLTLWNGSWTDIWF